MLSKISFARVSSLPVSSIKNVSSPRSVVTSRIPPSPILSGFRPSKVRYYSAQPLEQPQSAVPEDPVEEVNRDDVQPSRDELLNTIRQLEEEAKLSFLQMNLEMVKSIKLWVQSLTLSFLVVVSLSY
jgi:hypothetical protein